MNKEEIEKMFKENPIKIIKFNDIEVPVEWLKQTTVNVNGDDYIKLQQENKSLKEELKAVNKGLRKVLSKRKKWKYRYYKEKRKNRKAIKYIEDKIQKSFKADYGLEPFERTDRLFTETVIELQKIEQILDKGADS